MGINIDEIPIEVNGTPGNGAYILGEKEGIYKLMSPEELSCDYKAVGVAVIEDKKSLLVALDGFDYLPLVEGQGKRLDEPFYISRERAYRDFNGKENTEKLLKRDSIAARLCMGYNKGNIEDWWVPSFGEFELMYRYKTPLNECLMACGGDLIPETCHWSSTAMCHNRAMVFDWETGNVTAVFVSYNHRVRPVSAIPELTI